MKSIMKKNWERASAYVSSLLQKRCLSTDMNPGPLPNI
jgi:hypothetical protein